MSLCKDSDDMWFWAMLVLNNVKIKTVGSGKSLKTIDGTQEYGLWQTKNKGGNNDNNIELLLEYYGNLLDKLEKNDYIFQKPVECFFSIKNKCYDNIKYKFITILGIRISLKCK